LTPSPARQLFRRSHEDHFSKSICDPYHLQTLAFGQILARNRDFPHVLVSSPQLPQFSYPAELAGQQS
jgi:hypothetical protein